MRYPNGSPVKGDNARKLREDMKTLRRASGRTFESLGREGGFGHATYQRLMTGGSPNLEAFVSFVSLCLSELGRAPKGLHPDCMNLGWWQVRWMTVGPGADRRDDYDATWEGDASGLTVFSTIPPGSFWEPVPGGRDLVQEMWQAGKSDDLELALSAAEQLRRQAAGSGLPHFVAWQAWAYWLAESGNLRAAQVEMGNLLAAVERAFGDEQENLIVLVLRRLADKEAELGMHRQAAQRYERILARPDWGGATNQLLARLGWTRLLAERGHTLLAVEALQRVEAEANDLFGPQHPARLRLRMELFRLSSVLPRAACQRPAEADALDKEFTRSFGSQHRYTHLLKGSLLEARWNAARHEFPASGARAAGGGGRRPRLVQPESQQGSGPASAWSGTSGIRHAEAAGRGDVS